jgi:hypothetical protein
MRARTMIGHSQFPNTVPTRDMSFFEYCTDRVSDIALIPLPLLSRL